MPSRPDDEELTIGAGPVRSALGAVWRGARTALRRPIRGSWPCHSMSGSSLSHPIDDALRDAPKRRKCSSTPSPSGVVGLAALVMAAVYP
jgi:hypothetical protein